MQLRISLVLLCCLAAVVIVQSETTIEVDENGDEYEVKRFNIEGRQLNGGSSKCVITRRKRSTAAAVASADENVGNSGHQTVNTSGTKSRKSSKVDAQVQHDSYNSFDGVGLMENSNYGDNNYDDDYDYDDDDGMQVPIIIQKQIVSPYISQQVATENLNGNGLFVIQTNEPPEVNPETHAVFELLPVNHAIHAVSGHKVNEYGELQFEEEISPVSTTGIWSTGEDDDNKRYDDELDDDYDDEMGDLDDGADVTEKPSKPSKPKKKKKKPSRKTEQSPAKRPNKNTKNRRRPSKKGPIRVNDNNKKKNRFSRPNNKPYARRGNRRGSNRRKNANNNRFKYSNNRNRFNNNRRKNKKRVGPKADDWLTKTETITATGTADEDEDKNCIIIRKDQSSTSTTTTPRPFWNFLGRNENNNSRQFGNRKRVNLRLVAKD